MRHQKDHKEKANKGVNVRIGVTGHVAAPEKDCQGDVDS